MITTKQIKKSSVWFTTLLVIIFEGCHPSPSSLSAKDLYSSSLLYVCIRCVQMGRNDTMEVCYPYSSLVYILDQDSSTKQLCTDISNHILNGEILVLPENHPLLRKTIIPDSSVDSIYALGYNQLLRKFFFCYDELNKENCCCMDWLHSACGNSVYFGHWSTPCYYKEGDSIMNFEKQYYIISLLYKNNIYCSLDENGNIHLSNNNLKKEDFIHIPFPTVEIR